MEISKQSLFPFMIYNEGIRYDDHITLYPVTMKDIISFQLFSEAVTVRKNSIFHDKKIIKMSYLEFLIHCFGNKELEEEYRIPGLSGYYLYAIQLLQLCCRDAEIKLNRQTCQLFINEEPVTPQIFDDLRRIIIIQNDIDFDMDEFLNYDTEQSLKKAQKALDKNGEKAGIEDYIDSLVIAMNTTEERVMNMTIRKFWRYIRRYRLHESYTIAKTGECSGMVTFKEPVRHWMVSLDNEDKYEHLKADENQIKKILL